MITQDLVALRNLAEETVERELDFDGMSPNQGSTYCDKLARNYISATNPEELIELLDALEVQAARIADLEADRDHWKAARESAMFAGEQMRAELDALRVQEPVACYADHRLTPEGTTEFFGYADKKLIPGRLLYAFPVPPTKPLDVHAELVAAAERVSLKYGYADDGTPSDWTEWKDLREAISAVCRVSAPALAVGAADGWKLVPVEPNSTMLDRAAAFALQVSLSREYGWTQYMRDLWGRMLSGAPSKRRRRGEG